MPLAFFLRICLQAVPFDSASSRVDLTDQFLRYALYRFTDADGDSWFIEGPTDGLHPLTQQRFEEALTSYFR